MPMSRRFRPTTFCLALLLFGLLVTSLWAAVKHQQPPEGNAAGSAKEIWTLKEIEVEKSELTGWEQEVDGFFGKYLVTPLKVVLFYDFGTSRWLNRHAEPVVDCPTCKAKFENVKPWPVDPVSEVASCLKCAAEGKQTQIQIVRGTSVPLVVLWLLAGAIFFTLRMRFINFRGFWHGIRLTKGDYDKPEETGEVSHFQALASALSATIGLGNIAGVAIAVINGGPGAVFWMIVAGLLGMTSKFAECTLSQMYRKVAPDGTVSGGPMHYLHEGLKEKRIFGLSLGPLGVVLGVGFAIMCMGGSFGGGCAFQVSQSLGPIRAKLTFLQDAPWLYGLVLAVMVGLVIIGGIRRIAATAEKIVPLMCIIYVLTAVWILLANFSHIGSAFALIFTEAFRWESVYGGFLGVLVIGIKRAAFSNEAGIGSAAIAHAAAKTEEPVREGIVASLGPFIDTVVICTMTGLVVVITGVYDKGNPEFADVPGYTQMIDTEKGAALTSLAVGTAGDVFPWILCLAVFLFAYSTMISWSYYGERCWSHLFGTRVSLIYKLLFLVFVVLGSVVTASNIKDFSDFMILSMAFPNILGVALMSGKIRHALDDYWRRYKAGEMERK